MSGNVKNVSLIIIYCFSLVLFCLISCTSINLKKNGALDTDPFNNLIKEITNELSSVSAQNFSDGRQLLITSFVDLNNLKKSSAFGRLISERLMTSMGNRGYNIIELRSGSNIFIIEKQGEMILTRNNNEIPDKIYGGAIVYGTYLVLEQKIFVTARIARASDFSILRSWSGEIIKTPFIENLLQNSIFEVDVYERMPKSE